MKEQLKMKSANVKKTNAIEIAVAKLQILPIIVHLRFVEHSFVSFFVDKRNFLS